MAKIEMGILGGFSGRVGTVVGYYRRGRWYVRAYQPNIKDRRSEAQLAQRSRFKAMIRFASQATGVLRVGLREAARAVGLTEGNVFLRENHACFGTANYANCAKAGAAELGADCSNGCRRVDFAGLRFSKGSLPGVRLVEAEVDEGGALRVRWQSLGGVLGDRIHIYIYDAASGRGLAAAGTRGEGRAEVLLPEEFRVGELHVWAFAEGKGGRVSGTAYAAPHDGSAEGEEKNFQPTRNICAARALLKLNYNKTHEPDCCTHPAAPDGLHGCGPD